MGTRGLLGFIIVGQRYASYNQSDCYPEGLGKDIMNFLLKLTHEDWGKMLELVKEIKWVDQKAEAPVELQDKYMKLGYHLTAEMAESREEYMKEGYSVYDETSDWYSLLRAVQGSRALEEILKGDLKHMTQNVEFLEDGVCCEWAYFINFEKKALRLGQMDSFWTKFGLSGSV
ncbi:uncharacterized protein LY89DRAFT_204730 [Mollisia scopiformis]|uniref:Uncharacterized protein n=1 Tax=Mollisia scopiformis TaxID=149040 RepID=A0A194WWD8_MOLSC|nr:uncharacterized protein LY89DRAFT_204730 [Mollisia scopiformis]KUJ12291.1 hypothetical protein LY89DRAFT_204730 [Mollisia scopiformis]